eukprot:Gregarina_sp_Poly_1__204@NODE_1047_length_5252_cov_120_237030_g727_i0_p2_GENE_NODE_1047_length_5252_cov_120_237030_g727_i0NODE_1047_length_5252_cov_120_237030_g727_i0_p2_ORF_typecomplete_len479_score24_57Mannosyl_trans/PF05007_13/1_4e62PIGU/PF06728_13/7_4e28PIGU/PF06728_13/3_9GT87/PF09594_10/1e04GT87/PF09594_10/2_7e17GT87/PF09594_10/4e02PMT_2/PF13231_6/1_5e07PMT_2/PF13231_6/8_9e02PMT_2/PF13231_6/3_9e03PMT_2/PF13231_6/1_4e03_NODE_1047_length_5252_cov_120_237030_g727_i035835019
MAKPGWSCTHLLVGSLVLHLAFLAYGEVQDWFLNVKYTDIDYAIYNGGAEGILHKSVDVVQSMEDIDTFLTKASPYWRSTYRYSPVMAILVMPNLWLGPVYGKILFSIFDTLTGWIMHKILIFRQVEENTGKILLSIWLFNPLAVQVSTRGNSDSVMTLLVATLIYLVLTKRSLLAGLCLGLAVHVKIYPVLYAFPLLMTWNDDCTLETLRLDLVGHIQARVEHNLWDKLLMTSSKLCVQLLIAPWRFIYRFLVKRLNSEQWLFGLSALGTFALITGGFYLKYGWTFLFETYLYHGMRHDHRHNFSPFSAWATLATPRRDPTEEIAFQYGTLSHFRLVQKLTQLPLTLLLGFSFIRSAPELSLFLQTAWFVIFNSVSTAQYFIWYLALLPLALATSKRVQRGKNLGSLWIGLFVLLSIWLAADLHWIYWSHRFEYKGQSDAFLALFLATWVFAGACILLINFVLHWISEDKAAEDKSE